MQEELNELKKQKEHQDEVNNRIKEIEEELDNYATIREKRLKEVNAEILELENKIKIAE